VKLLRVYGNFTLKSVKIESPNASEDSNISAIIKSIEYVSIEDSPMKLYIGIAVVLILLIIIGTGIFFVLRRRRTHSESIKKSKNVRNSTTESLESNDSQNSNDTN
jgi:hypothetical protein